MSEHIHACPITGMLPKVTTKQATSDIWTCEISSKKRLGYSEEYVLTEIRIVCGGKTEKGAIEHAADKWNAIFSNHD